MWASRTCVLLLAGAGLLAPACADPVVGEEDLDWEAFREDVKVVEDGRAYYRLEWDYTFASLDDLRDYYEKFVNPDGASRFRSRVHLYDGERDLWPREKVRHLTYCVSWRLEFDDAYEQTVLDMEDAAARWSALADVGFEHLAQYDDACDPLFDHDPPVDFVVRRKFGGGTDSCATYPNDPRSCAHQAGYAPMNWIQFNAVGVDVLPEWTSGMVIKHEMGHLLGLRHEAAEFRNESPSEALTAHDVGSIMNYPGEFGAPTTLDITPTDGQGLRILYGMPVSMLSAVVL